MKVEYGNVLREKRIIVFNRRRYIEKYRYYKEKSIVDKISI